MLFFKIVCFVWAAIGIISRIAMALMRDNWSIWEEGKAYKEERPVWIVLVGIVGIILIGATWSIYFIIGVPYGWVLASLISLTIFKILKLLFNYKQFRLFLNKTLADKNKMLKLNIAVIIISTVLIFMGIFLY